MKLPDRKKRELAEKGKPDSPELPGGPAIGRLREFQKQRGIQDQTRLSNPATTKSTKTKPKTRKK